MTGKIKLTMILTSVILVIVAVTTAGVSLALWTSQSGGVGGSSTSVSPSVMPINEYVWAKYFEYEVIKDESGNPTTNVIVTKFYTDNAGVNLEDVVIPSQFVSNETHTDESGVEHTANVIYKTTRISSQVFMDMTLKKLPVTIYIPGTVVEIDGFAFSNLPNLQRIVFMPGEQPCVIKDYAFSFCSNLSSIEPNKRELRYESNVGNAFLGSATMPTPPATA